MVMEPQCPMQYTGTQKINKIKNHGGFAVGNLSHVTLPKGNGY